MFLSMIHDRLANTVLMYFLIMLLWSFWRFAKKEGAGPNFLGAVVISEILIIIQGGLGLFLWLNQIRPEHGTMHVLYGIIGAIGLPAWFTFNKDRSYRLEMLVYGVVYFCLVALIVRSMMTG